MFAANILLVRATASDCRALPTLVRLLFTRRSELARALLLPSSQFGPSVRICALLSNPFSYLCVSSSLHFTRVSPSTSLLSRQSHFP